jgi:hypothetical protein
MTKHALTLLLCGLLGTATAQPVHSLWPLGTNEFPDTVPGYGNTLLRFEPGILKALPASLRMNFESTAAAVADSLGNLLFYTNGCYVADAQGDTMPGGAGLNPGEMHDWTCPSVGYASPKGAMTLPWPGRSRQYLLLHMGVRYDAARKITYGPLYWSAVDLGQNGGKGAVTSRNNVLLDGDLEPFTAVRHGNGRDWWAVVPEHGTARYHRFVLSPAGFSSDEVQEIGPAMACKRIGTSAFSPNGLRYGRQQNCLTTVLDFDRCTGAFSSPIVFSTAAHTFGGGGIGFSPDGSRLYTTSQLTVLEADLTQSDPKLDTLIFTYEYWQWGTSMGPLQQGDDNHLYISNMAREKYFSRVRFGQPDGSDAQYEFKAVALPRFSVRTLPNSPNFRLGDLHGSPCDTLGITPTAEPQIAAAFAVSVSPNPARDEAVLRDFSPESVAQERTWRVFSAPGQLLRSAALPPGTAEHRLDLRGLPPGLYWWEMLRADGSRAAGRLAVQ